MGDTRPWLTLAARASMPWLETAPVDERERFIADYRLELYTMADLCARYNVSRKTGYKWSTVRRRADAPRCAIGAAHQREYRGSPITWTVHGATRLRPVADLRRSA